MKTCSVCSTEKSLTDFDIQSTGRQGRRADCKDCRKRFVQTPEGLVGRIYRQQKAASQRRGHPAPAYTLEGLTKSMLASPKFLQLYKDWVASGYQKDKSPSVDRINDHLPYQKGNLQLMTFAENRTKGHDSCRDGVFDTVRAVDMLSLDGVYIRSFISLSDAARHFKGIPGNIVGAITQRRGKRKNPDGSYRETVVLTAYGHKWRYS